MDNQTPLLDTISSPEELRNIDMALLPQLATELRQELVNTVSVTGGHLGAGLGVVELTIALHHVFNTPNDNIVWDVGHQAYPHKILTGRRDRMHTLRQKNGLSGFTKRTESPYDTFGTGHSSTSVSAGLGMAIASELQQKDKITIAVIGDGAFSAGMVYEAMNNASERDNRLVVILNDNDMSIDQPVGAISSYLARLTSSGSYLGFRAAAKQLATILPKNWEERARRWEEYTRNFWSGGVLFEEMGFYYVGPLDGHDFTHLLPVLQNIKTSTKSPILLHVVTKKGKGYQHAEAADDKFHGVGKFNIVTGKPEPTQPAPPSYTKIFSNSLISAAKKDEKIAAITAAMPSGTGLNAFCEEFPERFFDVGIAEQHAVTFAAGMACEGMKPFVAIYSTFLQRAYDQIVHDVALQKLPVRFAIDRAGLVGADGPTHAGSFDIAFLSNLPGFTVMAAADELELARMVVTAAGINDGPSAFRYPRGASTGLCEIDFDAIEPLEIGKGRIVKEGKGVAILSFGTRLSECYAAADELAKYGLNPTIADARFAKPLDTGLIEMLASEHELLITLEEGAQGGFGAHVLAYLSDNNLLDKELRVRTLTLPDVFQQQAKPEEMYHEAGLDHEGIAQTILSLMDLKPEISHTAQKS